MKIISGVGVNYIYIPLFSFRTEFAWAAGLGFEPRLPDPESGVLPLDDPAIDMYILAGYSDQIICQIFYHLVKCLQVLKSNRQRVKLTFTGERFMFMINASCGAG